MKKLLLVSTAIAFSAAMHAQEKNNLSAAIDFKSLAHVGRMQTSDAFQSYKSESVTGTQFYNTTWSEGSVTTTTNEVINNYLLLYDKVRQELFIRAKDTNMVIQADKSQVKSFTLKMAATHVFVPALQYDQLLSNSFFEVLVKDAGYSLFKLTKTTFQKADYSDMLKVRNGEVSDAFVDEVGYYVYHKGELVKIALKERSVRKGLGDFSPKVDAFLDAHQNEDMSEQLLTNLVTALNQQ